MEHGFIFDLNPIITTIGPLQLRYYGLIFAVMLGIGFLLWHWQMVRGGYSSDLARKFFIWGVIAVLAGSRLGHCLFYEPERYLADPISILFLMAKRVGQPRSYCWVGSGNAWFFHQTQAPVHRNPGPVFHVGRRRRNNGSAGEFF